MLERSLALAVLLAACSPGPAPVSHSKTDPASPNAPEGVSPTVAVAVADARAHAHEHAATTYVCPMHPEVTSDKPDQTCPKCNMKLVPKP